MSSLKRTKKQVLHYLIKQFPKKVFRRCEVDNMTEVRLFYPEYANTFALTYAIACAEDNKIAGAHWTSELYDWGKARRLEMGDTYNLNDNEIVAFYGTDAEIKYGSLTGSTAKIKLPVYHPRLIFMPYDYTIYESVYKNSKINPKGIITSEDIKDIPSIDDLSVFFSERGVSEKLKSDTEAQAVFLQKVLFGDAYKSTKEHPIQLFYYGAPLTIFYLNSYPKFLPIRIDVSLNNKLGVLPDNNKVKKDYSDLFNTYLFLRIGKNVDQDLINGIQEKVKESFFHIYSDALLDPQLLSNVYKKYKEDVPRGLFYTMRSVEDFAKAITLHCEAEIEKIREEIGFEGTKGKVVEEKHRRMLRFLKEFTSKSDRSSKEERNSDLQNIKDLALGCGAFLFFSFCRKKDNNKTDWYQVFDSDNRKEFELEGTYLHLYKSIITCLSWRYCLLYYFLDKKKTVRRTLCPYSTLTRPILMTDHRKYVISELDIDRTAENDYIQYKAIEKSVVVALSNRMSEDGSPDEKMMEVKKCISYVEYILDSFVEDSFKNTNSDHLRTAYRKFNEIVRERYDYDKVTHALLEKFLPFKVYEY